MVLSCLCLSQTEAFLESRKPNQPSSQTSKNIFVMLFLDIMKIASLPRMSNWGVFLVLLEQHAHKEYLRDTRSPELRRYSMRPFEGSERAPAGQWLPDGKAAVKSKTLNVIPCCGLTWQAAGHQPTIRPLPSSPSHSGMGEENQGEK